MNPARRATGEECSLFTLFFRAIVLYAVMIAAMRLMGRRQLGEFQPYEFALALLLADLISSPRRACPPRSCTG